MGADFFNTQWTLRTTGYNGPIFSQVKIGSFEESKIKYIEIKTDKLKIIFDQQYSKDAVIKAQYTFIDGSEEGPADIEVKDSGELRVVPNPQLNRNNRHWTLQKVPPKSSPNNLETEKSSSTKASCTIKAASLMQRILKSK